MDRIREIEERVDAMLEGITAEKWKREGYVHLHGVAQFCALLAMHRGENAELAAIAGLLHDIKSYRTLDYEDHAHLGAKMAYEVLQETELFSGEEMERICTAIFHHSEKELQHDGLTEVLIDADVMQHSLSRPLHPPKPHEAQRYAHILQELNMQ